MFLGLDSIGIIYLLKSYPLQEKKAFNHLPASNRPFTVIRLVLKICNLPPGDKLRISNGKDSSNPLGYVGNLVVTPFVNVSYNKPHFHFGEYGQGKRLVGRIVTSNVNS
jgi:hypothetical protein